MPVSAKAESALNGRAELLDGERLREILERSVEEELAAVRNEVERNHRQGRSRRAGPRARGIPAIRARAASGRHERSGTPGPSTIASCPSRSTRTVATAAHRDPLLTNTLAIAMSRPCSPREGSACGRYEWGMSRRAEKAPLYERTRPEPHRARGSLPGHAGRPRRRPRNVRSEPSGAAAARRRSA